MFFELFLQVQTFLSKKKKLHQRFHMQHVKNTLTWLHHHRDFRRASETHMLTYGLKYLFSIWNRCKKTRMLCPVAARSPLGGTSPSAQLARWSCSQGHLQSATEHLRAILQNVSALFTCYVPGRQAPCLKCPHMKISLCENEALGH